MKHVMTRYLVQSVAILFKNLLGTLLPTSMAAHFLGTHLSDLSHPIRGIVALLVELKSPLPLKGLMTVQLETTCVKVSATRWRR